MSGYSETIQRLMDALGRLPGIGERTAERLAFHILKSPSNEAMRLASAIEDVKTKIHPCGKCFNLAENDLCEICSAPNRDQLQICVVEQPKDLLALESTGAYNGVYHVLMGTISPLDNIDADDLTIDSLVERVKADGIGEVILATNPTVSGDATCMEITERLKGLDVKVTRLARGLPSGGQIEYSSKSILSDAINERRGV